MQIFEYSGLIFLRRPRWLCNGTLKCVHNKNHKIREFRPIVSKFSAGSNSVFKWKTRKIPRCVYVVGLSRKNKNLVNSAFNSSIFILILEELGMSFFLFFTTWIFFRLAASVLPARLSWRAAVFSILLNYEHVVSWRSAFRCIRIQNNAIINVRFFMNFPSLQLRLHGRIDDRFGSKWYEAVTPNLHGLMPVCGRRA